MWLSILFSNLGGQITLLALPLTAVFLLDASPTQMGLLTAMEIAPFVLLSLPGGVLLDRMQKLPVYIAGEIVMGLSLLTIPLAWALDLLSINLMYVVCFAIGAVYTIAGSASQLVLTQLVGRDKLVEAYSQNAIAGSMAEVMGPGLAGILIRVFGAPLALVMDALLLIGSVLMLKAFASMKKCPQGRHGKTDLSKMNCGKALTLSARIPCFSKWRPLWVRGNFLHKWRCLFRLFLRSRT